MTDLEQYQNDVALVSAALRADAGQRYDTDALDALHVLLLHGVVKRLEHRLRWPRKPLTDEDARSKLRRTLRHGGYVT